MKLIIYILEYLNKLVLHFLTNKKTKYLIFDIMFSY